MTGPGEPPYGLTLYVNGASDRSARAITNATSLCERHLAGRYELTVVDLREQAQADAVDGRLLAAPTLVRNRPLPVLRHVGDLARTAMVLETLHLPFADGAAE